MRPQTRSYRLGDRQWWLVCAHYASALQARRAWEHVERKVPRGSLGIYRHGPKDDPGSHVSAVSLEREQVERVGRLLRDGEDVALPDSLAYSLIVRRARVVVEAVREHGDVTGRVKWRRPERGGATLTPTGEMIDPEPGQG
jgi:hypothetical protein